MFVFVSHSSVDIVSARELATWLTEQQIPYFLDESSIAWGNLISEDVKASIAKATHFVILVSPHSLESGWVNYELGFAEGLYVARPSQIRILPWVVYPVKNIPLFLADRKSKSSLKEVVAELVFSAQTELAKRSTSSHDPIFGTGYKYKGARAQALRLIGAADEHFTRSDVAVEVSHQRYILPDDILRSKADILAKLTEANESSKAQFFDGPHTRLMDYSVAGTDPYSEKKRLTLRLGPIGWYDYSVIRWITDQLDSAGLLKYINLQEIGRSGSVVHTKLHNILDTGTTLVTSDGYLLYSQRGTRVSCDGGLLTCTVAENIHQEKDGSLSDASNSECPAPFRAALRGLDEELSPVIARAFVESGSPLYCLGLSFDLLCYHPGILFFAVLPFTCEQVINACAERPGHDYHEGHIKGLCIIDNGEAVVRELSLDNWSGGGKASVIRALEFLETRAMRQGKSVLQIIADVLSAREA